jgi:hypothetical protein
MARINCALAVVAAAVALALGGAQVGAGESTYLGYKFAEGHSQEYKVKFNQEVDFGNFAMSQIIDMEVTEKCVGMDDSLHLMEIDFDKVESTRMQFDKMVDDPTGENLTGHAVTFKVDKHGETSDMRAVGYIEGWERMKKVVESMVDNWYAYLPDTTINEGSGWSQDEGPKHEGMLTYSNKADFHFAEVKKEKNRQCAKITAETENTVSGSQDTPAGSMDVTGGGTGEVEFYYCMKSSTIIKYKAKVEMKMDLEPQGGGDTTQMTVNVVMEREVK